MGLSMWLSQCQGLQLGLVEAEPRAAVDWGCQRKECSGEGLFLQELHMGLCVGLTSRVLPQPILFCDYVLTLGNNVK